VRILKETGKRSCTAEGGYRLEQTASVNRPQPQTGLKIIKMLGGMLLAHLRMELCRRKVQQGARPRGEQRSAAAEGSHQRTARIVLSKHPIVLSYHSGAFSQTRRGVFIPVTVTVTTNHPGEPPAGQGMPSNSQAAG
jgi:hypothetical protein